MNQVRIGPKFFQNELRVYRNWAMAFWRELVQNSYDAHSSRIDIEIGESVDGVTTIVFWDNGEGMTRETLEDVYFNLGETTKTGDSVGGFGKARILNAFAQKSYKLWTKNLEVTGEGSAYDIQETDSIVKGVKLQINVYDKGVNLLAQLQDYLRKSHLPGTVVRINNQVWTEWTYKNQYARSLSFGNLYTNKSKQAGILVRVNGVHMFQPYTSAPFLVILEIDQSRSREVLQASRDGLLQEFQNELESFINDLNINKRSALKERRRKSMRFEGSGTFVTTRKDRRKIVKEVNEVRETIAGVVKTVPVSEVMEVTGIVAPTEVSTNEFPQSPAQPSFHKSSDVEEEYVEELKFNLFNMITHDETNNADKRKVIDSYSPLNWDLLGTQSNRYDYAKREWVSFRAGVDKYKLLILWKAAAEQAIESLYNVYANAPDSIAWGVGWLFSDDSEARHMNDGVHWLLFDPTNYRGLMRYKIASVDSLAELFVLALHEVAHIVASDHDENYANLLTEMMKDSMKRKSEIINHMKDSKAVADAQLNRMMEKGKVVA